VIIEPPPLATFAEELVTEIDRLTVLTTADLQRAGVSLAQGRLLSALFEQGRQRITQLAHSEHVSQPAMTSMVIKLEGLGLVVRADDASDSRAVLVELTESGHEMISALREARTTAIDRQLAALPSVQVRRLAAALPVLTDVITDMRAARREAGKARAERPGRAESLQS
jgi:DNA-binding MarR family transcriptional regulator